MERALAAAFVVALAVSVAPGADWAFQLAYPLLLALGAVGRRWWPVALVLLIPVAAGLDYGIGTPPESDSVDNGWQAALFALAIGVPIGIAVFALGRAVRALGLALGKRRDSSS